MAIEGLKLIVTTIESILKIFANLIKRLFICVSKEYNNFDTLLRVAPATPFNPCQSVFDKDKSLAKFSVIMFLSSSRSSAKGIVLQFG